MVAVTLLPALLVGLLLIPPPVEPPPPVPVPLLVAPAPAARDNLRAGGEEGVERGWWGWRPPDAVLRRLAVVVGLLMKARKAGNTPEEGWRGRGGVRRCIIEGG